MQSMSCGSATRARVSVPITSTFFGVTGLDDVIGQDHPLQPPRAAEREIEGNGVGVLDPQPVFDPRGQGGHRVLAQAVRVHVAEIMGNDDVVEAFPVHPVQRRLRRQERHVGGGDTSFGA